MFALQKKRRSKESSERLKALCQYCALFYHVLSQHFHKASVVIFYFLFCLSVDLVPKPVIKTEKTEVNPDAVMGRSTK